MAQCTSFVKHVLIEFGVAIVGFSYKLYNASSNCMGDALSVEVDSDVCGTGAELNLVDLGHLEIFSYSLTFPTCDASTIASFTSGDDDTHMRDDGAGFSLRDRSWLWIALALIAGAVAL